MPDPIQPQNNINPTPEPDVAPKPTPTQSQPMSPQTSQPLQSDQPEQPKKSHRGLIIWLIVAGVAFVLAIIIIAVVIMVYIFGPLNKSTTSYPATNTNTTSNSTSNSSSSTTTSDTSGSLADATLQRDIISYIAVAASTGGKNVTSSDVVVTSVQQVSKTSTQVIEDWYVTINGTQSVYKVTITPTSDGGADFTVTKKS